MRRCGHRHLDNVVVVVALIALADLVVVVGDAADVVGAGRKIAGQRRRDRLMILVAWLADRRQRPGCGQGRKHRV